MVTVHTHTISLADCNFYLTVTCVRSHPDIQWNPHRFGSLEETERKNNLWFQWDQMSPAKQATDCLSPRPGWRCSAEWREVITVGPSLQEETEGGRWGACEAQHSTHTRIQHITFELKPLNKGFSYNCDLQQIHCAANWMKVTHGVNRISSRRWSTGSQCIDLMIISHINTIRATSWTRLNFGTGYYFGGHFHYIIE